MIERERDRDLGLDGYGPEVAMYRAFLQRTRIHRPSTDGGGFRLGAPSATDSLAPAWMVVEEQFGRAKARRVNLRDLHRALVASPIGMKEGVIPVLLTAALLAFRDEIAIYEHGTFRPLLAPDVSERMLRNPHHFDIKHFANTAGARRELLQRAGGAARRPPGIPPIPGCERCGYRGANRVPVPEPRQLHAPNTFPKSRRPRGEESGNERCGTRPTPVRPPSRVLLPSRRSRRTRSTTWRRARTWIVWARRWMS